MAASEHFINPTANVAAPTPAITHHRSRLTAATAPDRLFHSYAELASDSSVIALPKHGDSTAAAESTMGWAATTAAMGSTPWLASSNGGTLVANTTSKLLDVLKTFITKTPWGKAAMLAGTAYTTYTTHAALNAVTPHEAINPLLMPPARGVTIETLPAHEGDAHHLPGKALPPRALTDHSGDAGYLITPNTPGLTLHPGGSPTRTKMTPEGFSQHNEPWADHILLSEQRPSEDQPLGAPQPRPSMVAHPDAPKSKFDLAHNFDVAVGRNIVTFSYRHPPVTYIEHGEQKLSDIRIYGHVDQRGIVQPTFIARGPAGQPHGMDLLSEALVALNRRGVPTFGLQAQWVNQGLFTSDAARFDRHLHAANVTRQSASQEILLDAAAHTFVGKATKRYDLETLSVRFDGVSAYAHFGNRAHNERYGAPERSASFAPWSRDLVGTLSANPTSSPVAVRAVRVDHLTFPIEGQLDTRFVNAGVDHLPTRHYSLDLSNVPALGTKGMAYADVHNASRLTWYELDKSNLSTQNEARIIRAFLDRIKADGVQINEIHLPWVDGYPEYARYRTLKASGMDIGDIIDSTSSIQAFDRLGYRLKKAEVRGDAVLTTLERR